jgi:hypothetical protein
MPGCATCPNLTQYDIVLDTMSLVICILCQELNYVLYDHQDVQHLLQLRYVFLYIYKVSINFS